jgi:uracil-DNA glycosylase
MARRGGRKVMASKTSTEAITTLIQRLNTNYPEARYELDWETPLQLLIATILAAQATDERINQITPALFARFPDAQSYVDADLSEIEQFVRASGFYKNKAKAIQNACKALVEHFAGEVPRTMDGMLTIPGVARKTANVVLNNAFRIPSGIIVDTHVARVSQRLGLSEQTKPEKIEQDLMRLVPQEEWVQFGPALVLHGRYTCTATAPQCGECVLNDLCPKIGVEAPAAEPVPGQELRTTKKVKLAAGKKAKAGVPVLGEDLPPSWREVLADEFDKPYFRELERFVAKERRDHTVFPPEEDVFTALKLTPYEKVKVLLLGQDPYHDDGQAHGLCFSVRPGIKPPPSLVNIFKELHDDLGFPVPDNGDLTAWAREGVLLLNAVLTVRAHQPNSHKDRSWETFTDAVIRALNERPDPVVFLLWGAYAQKKQELIDANRHDVLIAAHPSPLSSKRFFGSKPFSKANAALEKLGQAPIDWQLSNLAAAPAEKSAPEPKPALAQAASKPPPAPEPPPLPQLLREAPPLTAGWLNVLADEFHKPYFQKLDKFLAAERQAYSVCPPPEELFAAFTRTPFEQVKVVMLGNEPVARPGLANGLAYAVRPGVEPTSTLNKIFRQLRSDLGCWLPNTGELTPWARQGVLLLNTVLTVRAHTPESHAGKGWETFTDAVLRVLNGRRKPVVFLFWGEHETKRSLIDNPQHAVITGPAPAEVGFESSRPFSAINDALELRGQSAIYWQLFGAISFFQ